MIDTHSHIYDEAFDADRPDVVKRALAAGVERVILANVDVSSVAPLLRTVAEYPQFCVPAMGLHPSSVTADYKKELDGIEATLAQGHYCAVGEIGLDLYWDTSYFAQQVKVFETQLDWAIERQLPVIIHVRKAFAETLASLARFRGRGLRGVFHCFSGGIEEAKKAAAMGFMLGIGGVVTYKNSTLPAIVKATGLSHLLLETDAPYLSPTPYRGTRNEPARMVEVANCLSQIFTLPLADIDKITTENAKRLFGIMNN
jgi:TatD DNase family protein